MPDSGHVFISYKRDDAETANAVRLALKSEGFDVWWDEALQTGERWEQRIDEALMTAEAVVVLWTEASSSSDWVRHEASVAKIRGVLTHAVMDSVEIPGPFRAIQAAKLSQWNQREDDFEFCKLVSAIKNIADQRLREIAERKARLARTKKWAGVGILSALCLGGALGGYVGSTTGKLADEFREKEEMFEAYSKATHLLSGPKVRLAQSELGLPSTGTMDGQTRSALVTSLRDKYFSNIRVDLERGQGSQHRPQCGVAVESLRLLLLRDGHVHRAAEDIDSAIENIYANYEVNSRSMLPPDQAVLDYLVNCVLYPRSMLIKPQELDPIQSPQIRENTPELIEEPEEVIAETGTATRTSHIITDARITSSGRYMLLRLDSRKEIIIYDVNKKKIIDTIRLPTNNFLFATGGNTLLVYYPNGNLLQTWDIENRQKVLTKPSPKGAIVTRLTMGHSLGKRALVRYAASTDALATAGMFLLDTQKLIEIETDSDDGDAVPQNSSYRDFIHQRSNGSMNLVSEWTTSGAPTGLGIYALSDGSLDNRYEHDSVGYVRVGEDGSLYTEAGGIYNSQLTKIGELPGKKLIPDLAGSFFLGVSSDGSLDLYRSRSTASLGRIGLYPNLEKNELSTQNQSSESLLTFDRRIVMDTLRGYLLLIPPESDRIIQREFDLPAVLERTGTDYLVVASAPPSTFQLGKTWEYHPEILTNNAPAKIIIESGPEGMKLNDDGIIDWSVPEDYSDDIEKIVLLIENSKEAIYHSFEVHRID